MKLTTSLLIIALAASASAQQKPADQPTPVKSGTVSLAPAKPAAAQSKTAVAPSKNVTAPAPAKAHAAAVKATPAPKAKDPMAAPKPVAKKVHKSTHKAAPKVEAKAKEAPAATAPAETATAPEAEKEKKVASVDRSKRDPFQTVIRDRATTGGGCAGGGKQCLVPDEVALRGIVRSNGSIIAVVTTKENRAYFLRENDPVLNGVVTRITEGSITFREKTTDIFGKQSQREIVKKINPAAA